MIHLIQKIKHWYRRRVYKPGTVISKFVARDVRREVKIISVDGINDGFIVGQVRTNNVLYITRGLVSEQRYSDPVILDIRQLWNWPGQSWGGLPNGTSIVDNVRGNNDPSID